MGLPSCANVLLVAIMAGGAAARPTMAPSLDILAVERGEYGHDHRLLHRRCPHQPGLPLRLRGGMWRGGPGADARQDVEFTKKDQEDLNRYAGLNLRSKELEFEIESLAKSVDELEMARDEINVMDQSQPNFKVQWSGAYSTWTPEMALQMIEDKIQQIGTQTKQMREDVEDMRGDMAVIGARLKAKFGDEVRLDDESEE